MRILSKQEPIVPGVSIGGICLEEDAATVLDELERIGVATTHTAFENFGQRFSEWSIKDWGLSFVEGPSGKVIRIQCSPGYEGFYRDVFYPGMSIGQIVAASSKQLFIHGTIVIDGEFGAFFDVPELYEGRFYDDIDTIQQLPEGMILNQLHVMKRNWWRGHD